jgi:hypothetical protein
VSLLNPNARALLLESLRPPAGYQLDTAIGTTFTLDLVSLLVAPVGFTFFDIDPNDPGFLQQDPLEILEAIRRHASQIVLFCQAGRIAVPDRHRPLLTYLEDRIVEAAPPIKGYSFHPKVWFIRYTNEAGNVCYRLLCSSRNLTFDRCWDTLLTLDGPLRADRSNDFGNNAGLSAFVAALPEMAVSKAKVTAGVRRQLRTIENEIGRVEWDLNGTPFETLKFWPLGHDGKRTWPFRGRMQRTVVVAPFLAASTLDRLAKDSDVASALISRSETLDNVPLANLAKFTRTYQMQSQGALLEPDGIEAPAAEVIQLQGLHAKLYIADDGHSARVWTGSANATTAAFGGNVEFMVELAGKKGALGVAAFLEKINGEASFSDLLEPYRAPDAVEINEELETLKGELDNLRLPIASAEWTVTVSRPGPEDEYVPLVATKHSLPQWPEHVTVHCRPLSLGDSLAIALDSGASVNNAFNAVALETLTSFIVVRVSGENASGRYAVQFVVNATLVGAPSNRKERILTHMLRDQRALMRFLFLLLSDFGDDSFTTTNGQSKSWAQGSLGSSEEEALLEPLLRTLSRNPGRLNAVKNLIDELVASEDGKKLLPDGLADLFAVVWQASGHEAT